MKSTESRVIKKRNKVITSSREWTKEAYEQYRDYQINYAKENYRTFAFRLNREKDADLIEYFESKDNFADFIRYLGNKELKKEKGKK